MTIFATPFKASNLECTGHSVDSGFESIDQVVELMGSEHVTRTPRLVVYGAGEDRVVYSKDLTFSVDDEVNNV